MTTNLFLFFLLANTAQQEDLCKVGKLKYSSISEGDISCADITVHNDSVLEGPEVLTVTLTPRNVALNTVFITIMDQGIVELGWVGLF